MPEATPHPGPGQVRVLITKPEFTGTMEAEILRRAAADLPDITTPGPGMIVLKPGPSGRLSDTLTQPLIFERQRLDPAIAFPDQPLKPLIRDITRVLLPCIRSDHPGGWTCHAFTVDAAEGATGSVRSRNLADHLVAFCRDRFPRVARAYRPPETAGPDTMVLNLCVTPATTWGAAMATRDLSNPRPGGIHRMAFDRHAPSRSYLKVEEALDLLDIKPQPGETVVDLGAAPGGWTYAFVKRGCRVTAVDNGQLQLDSTGDRGGTVDHHRQDGTLYTPPAAAVPVDWLISDMLISTGTNLWVLKKWFTHRWMRRFIVNIKLPQEHPDPVLEPIESFLKDVPGIRFTIRHLYHDRREVTLFGTLAS